MAMAVSVDEGFAERHIAAAFAVDRARRRNPENRRESASPGKPAGMQFRITAGQPAEIAILRRRLVVER